MGQPDSLLSRSPLHTSSQHFGKTTVVLAAHAGGSATSLAAVRVRLMEHVDFIGIAYPGRGPSSIEKPPRSVDEMATHVITTIDARVSSDSAELTLWGYSLGALVMIEVARRLVRRGRPRVNHVVVAACRPPHLFSIRDLPVHAGDSEFVDAVRRLVGVPRRTLENPHWLAYAMPAIRADFLVCSQYQCNDTTPLPLPLTVLSGADDELAPPAQTREWHRYSTIACNEYAFSGGHFFVHDHVAEVAEIIVRAATSVSLALSV